MLNTWDRANIMKIIPTFPRVSLARFHQSALHYIYRYIYIEREGGREIEAEWVHDQTVVDI